MVNFSEHCVIGENNIKDKLSKTKTVDTEKVKNLMNFHNSCKLLLENLKSK